MPNLDGTGPMKQRLGKGMQNRPLGSKKCICQKCGHEESHKRGTPCSQIKCPKCQALMKGENCS